MTTHKKQSKKQRTFVNDQYEFEKANSGFHNDKGFFPDPKAVETYIEQRMKERQIQENAEEKLLKHLEQINLLEHIPDAVDFDTTYTTEKLYREMYDMIGNYHQRLHFHQIFGIMEMVKAMVMHEIGEHADKVKRENLCDKWHPAAPFIRCTKKKGHKGLCENEGVMWG